MTFHPLIRYEFGGFSISRCKSLYNRVGINDNNEKSPEGVVCKGEVLNDN